MKLELAMTEDLLFRQGLINSLVPERIFHLGDTDIFPFSDYYGALILAERIFQSQEKSSSNHKNMILEQLAKNVRVQNLRTPNGNSQTRILTLMHDTNSLEKPHQNPLTKVFTGILDNSDSQTENYSPETNTLTTEYLLFDQRLIRNLDPSKIKYLSRTELFPFSDFYGALVLAEEFLRTQELYQQKNGSNSFETKKNLITKYLIRNLNVPKLETTNGNLQERIMFLINNTNNPDELNQRLQIEIPTGASQGPDNLTELTKNYKLNFKLPKFNLPKINTRAVAGILGLGLAGVLTTGTIVTLSPKLRYDLGLPVSTDKEIEIMIDRGKFEQATNLIEEHFEDDEVESSNYRIKMYIASLNESLPEFEDSDLRTLQPYLDTNMGRIAGTEYEKDRIADLFDNGFVKYKDSYEEVNDYSTPRNAAVSHLTQILKVGEDEYDKLDKKEEKPVRLRSDGRSILVRSVEGNQVEFFAYENKILSNQTRDEIQDYIFTFQMEKIGKEYQTAAIKIREL